MLPGKYYCITQCNILVTKKKKPSRVEGGKTKADMTNKFNIIATLNNNAWRVPRIG